MTEEKNNDKKRDLGRLIKEAQKTGGFFYLTCRDPDGEPYDDTVYNNTVKYMAGLSNIQKLIAVRGFRSGFDDDNEEDIRLRDSIGVYLHNTTKRHETVAKLIKECEKIDRPVNEVVFYGEVMLCGKRALTGDLTLIDSSKGNEASQLSYSIVRKEPDKKTENPIITQTFVGPQDLVMRLKDMLIEDPSQVPKLFEGVFPKLDQKYHGVKNGRILTTHIESVVGVNLKDPDYAERFAQDYEVKGE